MRRANGRHSRKPASQQAAAGLSKRRWADLWFALLRLGGAEHKMMSRVSRTSPLETDRQLGRKQKANGRIS